MVIKRSPDGLLSLPCMVNSLPIKGNNEESCSGLILFSSKLCNLYVIAALSESADERKIAHNHKNHDFYNVKVIFKVSGQLHTMLASKLFQWKSPKFETQLKMVFQPKHQWKLAYAESESIRNDYSLLSTFSLYVVKRHAVNPQVYNIVAKQGDPLSMDKVWPGTAVTTISYPFGPDTMEIFTGAVSSGVVSNVCTADQGLLFMIDARCLPGSEGGGVYCVDSSSSVKNLVGIIVSPMCWKTQELVGVSICCTIWHILYTFHESAPSRLCELNDYLNSNAIGLSIIPHRIKLSPATVRIEVGGIWGSGVVCGAKLYGSNCQLVVCTCRHVIEKKLASDVLELYVTIEDDKYKYSANTLFATDESAVYDFALLSVHVNPNKITKVLRRLNRCNVSNECHVYDMSAYIAEQAAEGMPVFTKGYGIFDASCDVGPTFSHGTISNVVQHAGGDVLIHSTCLVHKGTSGGALVCQKSGKLIGITVNHVKDEEANIAYPDVNFSIPCSVFMPAVHKFLETGDRTPFDAMNLYHEEVHRIWGLKPHTDICDLNRRQVHSKL